MKNLLFILHFLPFLTIGQITSVHGIVTDEFSGSPMPFVKVKLSSSKNGTFTDSIGRYTISTTSHLDSIIYSFSGYLSSVKAIVPNQDQEINVSMRILSLDISEIIIRPPDVFPSTILHRKVVAHKAENSKQAHSSYSYELYSKIQLHLNNLGEDFQQNKRVKKIELVADYIDTSVTGSAQLPVLMSETISDFYFKGNPHPQKKEIVKASHVVGLENLQIDPFLGDMYTDISIYDNSIPLFNQSFISPIADNAHKFYRFYLEDSTFIGNNWCYKLRFIPKRTGDLTFQGELWIHDSTFAVKEIKATVSPTANLNYVEGLYFEQHFEQVQPAVWMLISEKMTVNLKLAKKTSMYGIYGEKYSSRRNYTIPNKLPLEFYTSGNSVEFMEGAKQRDAEYWKAARHTNLNLLEEKIETMVDSLETSQPFRRMKNGMFLAATGYYALGKIELGNLYNFVSFNPVEKFRLALAFRTTTRFSKKIQWSGNLAYGFGDKEPKYGLQMRYILQEKKRTLLKIFYQKDIEQIGQTVKTSTVGSTFGTLLRTGPLDKLTFVEKFGLTVEKDLIKDLQVTAGFEWKEYTALGIANYVHYSPVTNLYQQIERIRTREFQLSFRWSRDEEYLSGVFNRKAIQAKHPIYTIHLVAGVNNLFGSMNAYQKLEITLEHFKKLGRFGRLHYSMHAGSIFGTAAYPFLKIHAGNQSYWLNKTTFNKLNFFEFISDKYIEAVVENHWGGLFLDRIPLVKKLKLRLITTGRLAYGSISKRHETALLLPSFTKKFGKIPYAEVSVGIENIFKIGRVDFVWRLTHLDPNMSALGIRTRWAINF